MPLSATERITPPTSLLVIEYCTSGAERFSRDDAHPALSPALDGEGLLMAEALALDGAALRGCETTLALDARLRDSPYAWRLIAAGVKLHPLDDARAEAELYDAAAGWEATLLVAPEFDDELLNRARRLGRANLLGASLECIALAADKHALAEHLHSFGVPAPRGFALNRNAAWPADLRPVTDASPPSRESPLRYPVVVKPRFGCGSIDVSLIESAAEGARRWKPGGFHARVEEFTRGTAVSVAFLCGPNQAAPLPACLQILSGDGAFTYLGGRSPIESELALRATRLASRAVATLPGVGGWIGVDLVLGDDASGADDVVIEVNPRLTTSYIGLRKLLAPTNLVESMWKLHRGREPLPPFAAFGPPVRWDVAATSPD